MYEVNGTKFDSYTQAVRFASANNSTVILTTTGECKWSPLPAVSKKAAKRYQEQMNAFNAQKATR